MKTQYAYLGGALVGVAFAILYQTNDFISDVIAGVFILAGSTILNRVKWK